MEPAAPQNLNKFLQSSNCMANFAEYLDKGKILQMNLISKMWHEKCVPLIFTTANNLANVMPFKDSKVL